jgi:hypothetical protein
MNVHTKKKLNYIHIYIEIMCNSETTLLRGGEKGKEINRGSTISKCIAFVQVKDKTICTETC